MNKNVMNLNQEKFLNLLNPVKENLWKFCLSLTKSNESAKELLQETICTAYEYLDSIKSDVTFLSYIFSIANSKFLADKKRESRFDRIEDGNTDSWIATTTSPDIAVDITNLYEALDKLPFEQKQAIILFDIMGFSRNEICEIQSVSIDTLKARLYRGRKKLAKLLGVNNDLKDIDESKNQFERVKYAK